MKKAIQGVLFLVSIIMLAQSCKGDKECKGVLAIETEVICEGDVLRIIDKSTPVCKIKQIGWVAVEGFDSSQNPDLIKYLEPGSEIVLNKSDIPESHNLFFFIKDGKGGGTNSQLDVCFYISDDFDYSDESDVAEEYEEDVDDVEEVESPMETQPIAENRTKPNSSNNNSTTVSAKSSNSRSTTPATPTRTEIKRPQDTDEDGIPDSRDNCKTAFNPDQKDSDGDGKGDKCDSTPYPPAPKTTPKPVDKPADADNDGIPDSRDNCRTAYNPDQKDSDGDGKGDECDSTPIPVPTKPVVQDMDKDGIPDSRDNCKTAYNPDQKDSDGDGKGDKCDSTPLPVAPKPSIQDMDKDGIPDDRDNCKTSSNADQKDSDGDGVGDKCDPTPNGDPKPKTSPVETVKKKIANTPSDEDPDFLNKAYAGNRLRKKCAAATEVTTPISISIKPSQNFEIINAKVVSKGYGTLTINLKEGARTLKSYKGLDLIPGKREIGFSGLYEYLESGKTYTIELIPSGTALMSMAACEQSDFTDARVSIKQPTDGVVLFDLFINY